MSPARLLSMACVVAITSLVLAAPSQGLPETAPQHLVSKREALAAALDRHVTYREKALTALWAAGAEHSQVEGVKADRLTALGYSGAVVDLDYVIPLPAFSYHLTAGFGASGGLWANLHTGLDFAAPVGTSLVAVADGTVTDVSLVPAYGLRTILTLEEGTEVWYCHQSESLVWPGQSVEIGQPIGLVGVSGNTTGPHLHLEVRPDGGAPIDPNAWLMAHALTP